MAGTNWLPAKDAELSTFAQNFSTLVTATPTAYGLLAADATALASLVSSYTAALGTASNVSSRTEVTVALKDTARAALVATIRSLAKRIQAYPPVSAGQKTALGLPIHSGTYSPVPPPSTMPVVSVVNTGIRSHTIRLCDETTQAKRAKPIGTTGAEVFTYVAATATVPPADLEMWRFEGLATKGEFEVDYTADDVGKTAHIVARWYNRKGETGPASAAITRTIAA